MVDEHGGTEGLVTLDDVLVELLGDVGDEFKATDPVPEELGNGQWRLPGSVSVSDAAALLGIELTGADGRAMEGLLNLPRPAPGR